MEAVAFNKKQQSDGADKLVARARTGETDAFEQLLRQHYRLIFRVALRWLGNVSDAEEVTQAVAMRLAVAIRGFDGRLAFASWVYRMTLIAVRDLRRSQRRNRGPHNAVALFAEGSQSGGQEDAQRIADIWRAVRGLPDQQRDAVLLVHGEEMGQAEAARILGCKEPTVASHIHQARKALRQNLNASALTTRLTFCIRRNSGSLIWRGMRQMLASRGRSI